MSDAAFRAPNAIDREDRARAPVEPRTGFAFGKVILLGEHAVVYGAPALAPGIDRGARAIVTPLVPPSASTLVLGGRTVVADAEAADDLARALAALLAEGEPAGSVAVEAFTDLPPGGGLGCSAALAVAIARAVEPAGPHAEAAVLKRSTAWERIFHGNPSGIDTAAAARGGCLRFSRTEGVRPIEPAKDFWLCIGSSGPGASTRTMVEQVAKLHARKPEMVQKSVDGVTSLVDNAALAVEAGDLTALGRLMDLNQMILAGLMVSTESIEQMCGIARSEGALGAKLTGAGGGGSVIALVPSACAGAEHVSEPEVAEAARRILEAWRVKGFGGFVARVQARNPSLPRKEQP